MTNKEKLLIAAILIIVANFILLSMVYGQSNINIRAYVPETEENKKFSNNQAKIEKPTTKENKYLYFFENFWLSQSDEKSIAEAQTIHDKIMSHLLMWLILIIVAVIIFIIVRLINQYLISYFRS